MNGRAPIAADATPPAATTKLLQLARDGCEAALAFVATAEGDVEPTVEVYPTLPVGDPLDAAAVRRLVRQAWDDPELGQAPVVVRATRLVAGRTGPERRVAVALAPVGTRSGEGPWGILGIVGPADGRFEPARLELVGQVARRLTSHLRARHDVRRLAAPVPPGDDGGEAAPGGPARALGRGPSGGAS